MSLYLTMVVTNKFLICVSKKNFLNTNSEMTFIYTKDNDAGGYVGDAFVLTN